jgi:hypothetical protein
MCERAPLPELSEDQVAQIDRNLALGFDFLRDVLHRPEIVDEIPSGSTLAFRTFRIRPGVELRLTAFRAPRSRRWGVRVTGIGAPYDARTPDTSRWLFSIRPLMQHATWPSQNEAFAAVEGAVANAHDVQLLAG